MRETKKEFQVADFRWPSHCKKVLIFEPVSTHKYADAYLVAPCSCSVLPGRGGGGGKPAGLGSQGTEPDLSRAQLQPVFPGRTLALYWRGPLAVGIIWRKRILPSAHKGFSEAGGLGLDLWAELPGNGGGRARGPGPRLLCSSSAPSLGLSFAPLAGRLLWKRALSLLAGEQMPEQAGRAFCFWPWV